MVGYIIAESVNGQVSAGYIQPRLITELEEARVKSELEKIGLVNYRVTVKGIYATIYEPSHHEKDCLPMLRQMGILPARTKEIMAKMVNKGPFEPVMRFSLIDKDKRSFCAERMTYRGMGGWMSLSRPMALTKLLQKHLKHLGKESFYDLM